MANSTRSLNQGEISMIGGMIQSVFSNVSDRKIVEVCHAFLKVHGDNGYQVLTASICKTLMTWGLPYPTPPGAIREVSEKLAQAIPEDNRKMKVGNVYEIVSFLMVHGAPVPKKMPPEAVILSLVSIEAAALCLLDQPNSAAEIVESWNRIAPYVEAAERPI